jgi:hypothetical protein
MVEKRVCLRFVAASARVRRCCALPNKRARAPRRLFARGAGAHYATAFYEVQRAAEGLSRHVAGALPASMSFEAKTPPARTSARAAMPAPATPETERELPGS